MITAVLLFVLIDSTQTEAPWEEFQTLQRKIRSESIHKDSALSTLNTILPKFDIFFSQNNRGYSPVTSWRFPVEGYTWKAIGEHGNGYRDFGFDFFKKNRHNPHPAHDIFILDKNHDALDDRTQRPVAVLSISSGIVIESQHEWSDTSSLRGGKYVWIYDPLTKKFFYYAHLSEVFVNDGDCLVSGVAIGSVGRTGFNAFKKRSPTHLHLMVLEISALGIPKPINIYSTFKKMKTR